MVEVTMQVCPPWHLTKWKKSCKIDACIAPLVRAYEEGGFEMVASCCGHGKTYGRIDFADGSKIIIESVTPRPPP